MTKHWAAALLCGMGLSVASVGVVLAQEGSNEPEEPEEADRSVLPPVAPPFQGRIGETYKDSTPDFGPALPMAAPIGAPNVLLVVLDDVGFGQLGAYGGPIETPNIDNLAAGGLLYNNFHTTALSPPTRAALLTGRNHHAVAMAVTTEAATGFPGSFGSIPKSAATVAEVLKQNGYNTMAFGTWQLAPYTAYTAAGPFDRWPLGMGFEKYYGFLGGEAEPMAPLLIQDNQYIDTPIGPGYHVTEDLVDRAIGYIRDQQQASTGRPFFAYLAFGAADASPQAPKRYIDKYRGKFDQGWDQAREHAFERQKKLGIIPADTTLPAANPGAQPWAELDSDQRKAYARLQEAFASSVDHADHELGRLFAELERLGIRDNTLIILVSAHDEEMTKNLDTAGSASIYPKDPFIVSWPAKIKTGGVRSQYHHVVDVVPTLYQVIGVPAPAIVNGVKQMRLAGVSMAYTFGDAAAKTRKTVQYYEMFGSRAIWADGWTAVTWHQQDTPYDQDPWKLYHTDADVTESSDLAATNPEKLALLKKLWRDEAVKNRVLPLDDRRHERVIDSTRPVAAPPKDEYTYYPGTSIVRPPATPQIVGNQHTITAYVTMPKRGAEGVLASSGGESGGWTLFVKDGKLHYVHHDQRLKEFALTSSKTVPAGQHTLGVRFTPTSSNLEPDFVMGDVVLFIDDKPVGALKDIKVARQYGAITGHGLSIGRNAGTAVSKDYEPPFRFDGELEKVTIKVVPTTAASVAGE